MYLKNGKEKKRGFQYVHDRDRDARIYDQINSYAQASMDHMSVLDWLSGSTPSLASQQAFPSVPIYTPR